MKPIAVMTMAFLPATFLAALFAVPSLQWTGDKVITGKFWIYWTFTIPMTFAIFGLWLIITKWDVVLAFGRNIINAKESKVKSEEEASL